jgi:hypothetical protein
VFQPRIFIKLWESLSISAVFDALLLNEEEEGAHKIPAAENSPPLRSKPQARDPLEA